MTERWEIELQGHRIDLQDAQHAFPSGPVRIVLAHLPDGSSRTVLKADELEGASTADEAHSMGLRLVQWLNGALFVRHANRDHVMVGNVFERDSAGNFVQGFAIATAKIKLRSRASAVGQAIGLDGQLLPRPPQPQDRWFELADADDAVADVMTYLGRELNWFDIWKAFEVMRDDLNKKVGANNRASIGWPDTDHFERSAQVHRHAVKGKQAGYTVEQAMPLKEACKLVRELAEKWLAWRVCRLP